MAILKTHPREDLIRYLDADLSADEKRRVEEHLAGCSDCREFLSFAGDFNEGLSEITAAEFTSTEPCPDNWTLAAFEEGAIGEETARHVRAHLLLCDDCAEKFYTMRRARGPSWTRITLRAMEGLWDSIRITGSGHLLEPLPAAAAVRGEPASRAGAVHIEGAAQDLDSKATATLRLRVDAHPEKPEATLLLEVNPLPEGWKASLLDAREEEIAGVPLIEQRTIITSGLPYGFYCLNVSKGEERLASFEVDIRAV